MARFVPDRGDLVWLDFEPQHGREQAGRRAAITLSPRSYNGKIGLALFCPVTSQIKGYPFEVHLSEQGRVKGVVLADQIKSLDWRARRARFIEKSSVTSFNSVLDRVEAVLSME